MLSRRSAIRLGVWASVLLLACKKSEPPKTPAQQVGDAFVDRYLHADQQGALPHTALGAHAQLEKEIADTKEARKEGGAPDINVTFKRVGEEMRDKRIVLRYEVLPDGKNEVPRTLRLEIADLGKGPKVVLFEVR